MDEDFRAAGRDEVVREAPVTKFKMILGIPHPPVDECLKEIEPDYILNFFGRMCGSSSVPVRRRFGRSMMRFAGNMGWINDDFARACVL